MVDVPFNDFEGYHIDGNQKINKRWWTCLYLTKEFLRRIEAVVSKDTSVSVIEHPWFFHYACLLKNPHGIWFYDPYLRMRSPLKLTEDLSEMEVIVFNDDAKWLYWKIRSTLKDGVSMDKVYETKIPKVQNIQKGFIYTYPFTIPENLITEKERIPLRKEKKYLQIFVTEIISTTKTRMYEICYDPLDKKEFTSSVSNDEKRWNLWEGRSDFLRQIAPIADKFEMSIAELIDYLRYSANKHEDILKQT